MTSISPKFLLHIQAWEAKNLPSKDSNGYSDPYIKFKIGKEKQKSEIHRKTLFPVYNEAFTFAVKDAKQELRMEVWDKDKWTSDAIGFHIIPLEELEKDETMQSWFPLSDAKSTKIIPGAAVFVTFVVDKDVQFIKDVKDLKTPAMIERRKKITRSNI